MKSDFARNARLVASTTLLSLWGYSHLVQAPVLGDSVVPLLLALLVAPAPNWFGRGHGGYRFVLIAGLAFAAMAALLFWAGSEATLKAFSHDPWFVLPLWALASCGLVRNATSAARSAASAQAASAAAHATDAG